MIDFVDRSVTCTLNPELVAKMVDLSLDKEHGLEIIKIVKECMVHHHTKTCRKDHLGNGCRFRFPKFPIWQTILTKGAREQTDIDDEKMKKHRELLECVREVLDNDDIIKKIMEDYDKENESIVEYRENCKKRIFDVLELASVSPDE